MFRDLFRVWNTNANVFIKHFRKAGRYDNVILGDREEEPWLIKGDKLRKFVRGTTIACYLIRLNRAVLYPILKDPFL